MSNPLLEMAGLPPFSKIKPEDVEPAIDQLLAESRQTVEDLLAATSRSYIRAIVDYNVALAELSRVQGKLPQGLSIEGLEGRVGN